MSYLLANDREWDAYFSHCDHRHGHAVEELRGGRWTHEVRPDELVCPAIVASEVRVRRPDTGHSGTRSIEGAGTFRKRFPVGQRSEEIGSPSVFSKLFSVD